MFSSVSDAETFVFEKHADLPTDQRPVYRLADTTMTVNIREKRRVMSLFAKRLGGEYAKMWAGTLLRKFIRRPATASGTTLAQWPHRTVQHQRR
jgi:hypothetical protein